MEFKYRLKNIDDLALIMTLENGKPLSDSRIEINYASWFTDWFSEEAKRTYGKTIPSTIKDEIQTNIFLRYDDLDIKDALNLKNASDLEIFIRLRDLKDNF